MKLAALVAYARDKTNFLSLENYVDYCAKYLEFKDRGLQAVIISQNETNYRFYQYKAEGTFNITRPINNDLMYGAEDIDMLRAEFIKTVRDARSLNRLLKKS